MPYRTPLPDWARFQNAAWGVQDRLVIVAVPAAADQSLVGQPLLGQSLTTDGVYYCIVPLSGVVDTLQVHVRATLTGTVALGGPDSLYYVANTSDTSGFVVKTAGTGDGNLTTATILTGTLTGMLGEQYALVTITMTSATATFTMAEYNGI